MTTYKIIKVICMIFTVLTMLIYWKVKDFIDNINKQKFEPGEPCNHPGCSSHISHPCEGCGRIGAVKYPD